MRRVRIAAPAAALLMSSTLVACAADEQAGAPATPTSSPAAAATSAADTGASDPPAGDRISCLYGVWTADNASFLTRLSEFGDEVKDVTGEVTVTFAPDGSMTTEYRDWLITAVAGGATVTIHRNGTDTGTFTATDATVTLQDTRMGSTIVLSSGGVDMALEPTPSLYGDAPYSCDASSTAISTVDGILELTR